MGNLIHLPDQYRSTRVDYVKSLESELSSLKEENRELRENAGQLKIIVVAWFIPLMMAVFMFFPWQTIEPSKTVSSVTDAKIFEPWYQGLVQGISIGVLCFGFLGWVFLDRAYEQECKRSGKRGDFQKFVKDLLGIHWF